MAFRMLRKQLFIYQVEKLFIRGKRKFGDSIKYYFNFGQSLQLCLPFFLYRLQHFDFFRPDW